MYEKVYIYGAGVKYNEFKSYLNAYSDKIEPLGIITTNKIDYDYIDGLKVVRPTDVDYNDVDYVIIAVESWKPIFNTLKEVGCPKDKIIKSSVFSLPYFNLEKYLELKNSRVSIICNCCLGGFIYKILGMEVLSPTTNMYCRNDSYFKFLENLDFYLGKDIVENTGESSCSIPKGIIENEVIWFFNHTTDAEIAVEKWNKKRLDVNKDNIAIIMLLNTDEEAYRFEKLDFKKKIGIYYKDLDLKSVICLDQWAVDKELRLRFGFDFWVYSNYYLSGLYVQDKFKGLHSKVDWIKFLLGEDDYLRY